MRIARLLLFITFTCGVSASCFGQTNENNCANKEISHVEAGKQTELPDLGITIDMPKEWILANKRKAILKRKEVESVVEVKTIDFPKVLDSIFISNSSETKTIDLINNIKGLLDMSGKGKNGTAKLAFSKTDTRIENGFEIVTVYKVLNEHGFVIKAKLDRNCLDSKKEFDFIVESLRLAE